MSRPRTSYFSAAAGRLATPGRFVKDGEVGEGLFGGDRATTAVADHLKVRCGACVYLAKALMLPQRLGGRYDDDGGHKLRPQTTAAAERGGGGGIAWIPQLPLHGVYKSHSAAPRRQGN